MSSTTQSPRSAGNLAEEVSVQPNDIEQAVRLLRALLDGDEQGQRETFSFLKQALNEDRSADRKLFPSS